MLVVSGKVQFSDTKSSNKSLELVAGDKGVLNRNAKSLEKEEQKDPEELFWMNRTLIFNRTALFQVVETLNHLYGTKIRIDNQNIDQCKLTATFKNQPIAEIIEVVATTFELIVIEDNGQLILEGEGCF